MNTVRSERFRIFRVNTETGSSKEDKSFQHIHRSHKNWIETRDATTGVFLTATPGRGRLGNQLFVYAALLGISYKRGVIPYLRQNDPILKYFDVQFVREKDVKNLKAFSESGCCVYDARVETLSHERNISLSGYFQSWKYFAGAEKHLKTNIKFRETFLNTAKEFLQKENNTQSVFVGVHVRRGDKTNDVERSRGHSVAGPDYFHKAMEYFGHILDTNVTFMVVSDDKEWCHDNINGSNVVYSPFDDPGVDLALLSLCDHVIVSSGTYGWWGAWLSGGRTVFYNGYPRRQSWLASIMSKEDYYPLHWIGLS